MPSVPFGPQGASSPSLLETPSRTNLLMAAADMAKEGPASIPSGPERPRISLKRKSNRPLKVVK